MNGVLTLHTVSSSNSKKTDCGRYVSQAATVGSGLSGTSTPTVNCAACARSRKARESKERKTK